VVTYPTVGCLVAAESMSGVGADRQWESVNDQQAIFLERFFTSGRSEVQGLAEISSIASWNVEDVNRFLRERGFTIQLPSLSARAFAAASALDLVLRWTGTRTMIASTNTTTGAEPEELRMFPAVRLGDEMVRFSRVPGHLQAIATIHTQSDDQVHMTVMDDPPDSFELVDLAVRLSRTREATNEFEGVVFPMVSLDHKVDMDWLVGLKTSGDSGFPVGVASALQQTRFRMNELGARVESAVAVGITMGVGRVPPLLIIDKPFLIWIERAGLSRPLFVGFIGTDDWKDPGSLF